MPSYNRPYYTVLLYHIELENSHSLQNVELLLFLKLKEANQLFCKFKKKLFHFCSTTRPIIGLILTSRSVRFRVGFYAPPRSKYPNSC